MKVSINEINKFISTIENPPMRDFYQMAVNEETKIKRYHDEMQIDKTATFKVIVIKPVLLSEFGINAEYDWIIEIPD